MRQASVVLAVLICLSQVSFVMRAAAVEGYDAVYAGQSAFLTLSPGVTGTFTVFFLNTGTTTWTKGTATQVDLAACLADKVTCGIQDATEAPLNPGTWLAAARYATTASASVAPGSLATFSYAVKPPYGTIQGIYRFNGDLVVASTGALVHPQGYYQDVLVTAPSARVEITPGHDVEEVDIGHTVTVTYLNEAGSPAANVPLDIFVVRDATPFNDVTGHCSRAVEAIPAFTGLEPCQIDTADPLTDSQGKVQFNWSSRLELTHRVVAWTGALGTVFTTAAKTQGSATIQWHGRAGGLTLDPNPKTNRFLSVHTATVQVEEADGTQLPVGGLPIVWQILRGGSDAGLTCVGGVYLEITATSTEDTGVASLSYTGPTDPSVIGGNTISDCVVAFHDRNGNGIHDSNEASDAGIVTWSDALAGSGVTLSLVPSTSLRDDAETTVVTARLRDVFGDPIAGGLIDLEIRRNRVSTAIQESLGVVLATTLLTNAAGDATYSYVGPGHGATDRIDACADRNGDGDCTDATDVAYTAVTDVVTHWTNAAASSATAYNGRVLACDKANRVLYVYVLSGPVTGNLRFAYDTGDEFYLDNDGVIDGLLNGTVQTTLSWEAKCAIDDPVMIRYATSGTSQFENEGKTP